MRARTPAHANAHETHARTHARGARTHVFTNTCTNIFRAHKYTCTCIIVFRLSGMIGALNLHAGAGVPGQHGLAGVSRTLTGRGLRPELVDAGQAQGALAADAPGSEEVEAAAERRTNDSGHDFCIVIPYSHTLLVACTRRSKLRRLRPAKTAQIRVFDRVRNGGPCPPSPPAEPAWAHARACWRYGTG